MYESLFVNLYKSGCRLLMFGLESGSPSVIQNMKKKFTIPVAEKVLKWAHDAGIKNQIYFLIGFPTETNENFQESLDFIHRNHQYINEVSSGIGCQVEEGSDLFNNPEDYNVYWPENENRNAWNWYSDATTPEVRIERVLKLNQICESYGIIVYKSNLDNLASRNRNK